MRRCHESEGVSANTSNAPIEKKCLQKPHDVCYYAFKFSFKLLKSSDPYTPIENLPRKKENTFIVYNLI